MSTATAVAAPGTATRRDDIQGLRAVAVLMVMAYHAGLPLGGGFTGVDVFFVISGFVITSLLLRELDPTGTVSLRRFYTRRIRRLLPALAVVVVVTALVAIPVLSLQAQTLTGRTGVAASVILANVEIMNSTGGYFTPQADDNALLHTWSLSVEEQFYLLFPALLLLGWRVVGRRVGGRRGALVVTAAVMLASFALSQYLSSGRPLPGIDDPREFAFFSSPTRAWQFAVGALAALTWPSWERLRRGWPAWTSSLLVLMGAALVAVAAVAVRGTGFPGVAALVPTVGALLVILAADSARSWTARALASRPMVWVGGLSYSLYLWHWPVLVLGLALLPADTASLGLLLVVASVLPAYLSFRFVEQPIRGMSAIRGRRVLALLGVCVAVPATVSALLVLGAERSWGSAELREFEQLRTERPLGRSTGCHAAGPGGATPLGQCVFGEGGQGTVVVVGDSHADALGDSVVAAAEAAGYRAAIRTVNGCPFVADDFSVWHGFRAPERIATCVEGREQVWDDISALDPSLVVVANRSSWYIERVRGYDGESDAARGWADAVDDALDRLAELGIRALVVHTVPEHAGPLSDCAYAWGVDIECATSDRTFSDDRRALVVDGERAVVAAQPLASAWDPAQVLCDADVCWRTEGDVPLYLDAHHVTPSARLVLAEPLAEAMERVLR
jgi:peptidoglycan/LPS O-acetylase OafA/YrhL